MNLGEFFTEDSLDNEQQSKKAILVFSDALIKSKRKAYTQRSFSP